MINPIQLCDVANLHQREVEKDIALMQQAKLVKSSKIFRLKLVKRFVLLSFSSASNDRTTKPAEAVSR